MTKKMTDKPGRTTIVDVAKRAGVSPMTVSRVIRKRDKVSAATREKVEQAIAALNYSPNLAARALVGSRVRRVGLLYGNPSSAFLSELLLGALKAASEAEILLIVEQVDGDMAAEKWASRFHTDWDALIVPPPMSDSAALRKLVTEQQLPAVFLLSADTSGDVDQIGIDDYSAAIDMTAFLISKGHKRIGFIKGDPSQSVSNRRLEGFKAACANAGLPVTRDLIRAGQFTYESGQNAALKLLSLRERPTAIFASNDDMAAGAMAAAAQLGFSVPNEIAIAGFDDSPIATIVAPSLTTVRQPVAEMAEAAIRTLLETSPSKAAPQKSLADHKLIIRDTV